ncbi:MAG: efflux RND transporter periplasmic adaptor subunit [Bacteroidota bacterium]|nr:efflux RND transporter periplasmic adaptor subunit [Bacteroidota bacterium]
MKKIAVILLLIATLAGCSSHEKKTEDAPKKFCIPDSLMKQIQFDTVANKPVMNELQLIGKISYDQDKVVKIYPMVSGNVINVKPTLGDFVNKGQVLAMIRSSEMAGVQNDLITAQSNFIVAEKNHAAIADMYKSGISSEKEYVTSQKEVEKAKSELRRVKTVLSIYGSGRQSNYIVRAPISGYIVEKNVNPDMQIRSDNGTNLFTISDLKTIWVLANVYESDIAGVHLHDKVSVTTLSYPDKRFDGEIDKIYNVLDPDNKTMKVRIQLSNKENLLKPEMFANVAVQQKTDKTMLAAPANSIIFDRNRYWVVVYNNKCDVQIRWVEVANFNSRYAYISSGLKPGEKVITNMQLLIYNALNQ